MAPYNAMQTDKVKLSRLLLGQKPRQLAFAADRGRSWDVKNEAAVHLWFHKVFGHPVEPLSSMEDAVSTWPEQCICVAVRIKENDDQVIAPFGLDDLFAMKVRRNCKRASLETYRYRVQTKRYTERWPRVEVLD